jgi:membrane fusion protein, multidrug efflux system
MPNVISVEETSPVENASPPRTGTRTKIALLVVILLAAAGGAYAAYMHYRDQVSSDDAEVDGHVAAVAPKISGNVVEVLVDDNQEVKAGQVLVRIDPRDFQAKVDMAKAQLEHAESQLRAARVAVPWTSETTESGVAGSSAQLADAIAELERARLSFEQASGSDLAYAEANVRVKQASNERAQADLARMKPLADKAEISQLQYDSYVAAARVAENELQASREKLASAQKDAAIKKAALDAA